MNSGYFQGESFETQNDLFLQILQDEANKYPVVLKDSENSLTSVDNLSEDKSTELRKAKSCKKKDRKESASESITLTPKRRDSVGEIKSENKRNGHWMSQENKRYHWFLEVYNSHFVNRHLRRMDKIFKSMSLFVGTRQAEQCRSHHQKMEKKYHCFIEIIRNLRLQHYESSNLEMVELDLHENEIEYTANQLLNLESFQNIENRANELEEQKSDWHNEQNSVMEEEKEENLLDPIEEIFGEAHENSFINSLLM